MHGIQKKQLSKALAGMQICRISGPIIPWHTKHAGGINVPKRGSQNKQQIEKKKTNTTQQSYELKMKARETAVLASCR